MLFFFNLHFTFLIFLKCIYFKGSNRSIDTFSFPSWRVSLVPFLDHLPLKSTASNMATK